MELEQITLFSLSGSGPDAAFYQLMSFGSHTWVCWCCLICYDYELECPANSVDCCLQYGCSKHTQKRKDDCLLIILCLPVLKKKKFATKLGMAVLL